MTEPNFTEKMMLQLARDTRASAHAPYSGYTVGAACRAESGTVYFGCNIENASYPVGICAERVAVGSAVAHGEKKITAIVVAGGHSTCDPDPSLVPCGMCLQFMSEFMEPDGKILIATGTDSYAEFTLADLLPCGFSLEKIHTEKCDD